MENKKTVLQRLFIGFKKGYSTPTLPPNILKIQALPLIRILRFLGGVCFLIILSKNYSSIYVLCICMFICTIFTIYHFILSYYRIKHIIKVLKSDELDIRNSS